MNTKHKDMNPITKRMDFNDSVYTAIKDSEYLLDVDDDTKSSIYCSSTTCHVSFNYNMSYREVLIYSKLGKCLSQHSTQKLNVLDVGSGELLTAKKLIHDTSFVNTYTTIDNKIDPSEYIHDIQHCIDTFEYFNIDILKDDFVTDKKYDIVFIDVEPHGKEIEVYERVKHCLSPKHLCILKHVGFIDLYGSYLADRFLSKYEEHVSDYYAESVRNIISTLHQVRDVFIIFDTSTPNTSTMNIRELLF